MTELSRYEQETIINYNQEEQLASCYTHDKALIRKLDELVQKSSSITVIKTGDGVREYNFPKKWIKVQMPRQLSDEKRAELKLRALNNFHNQRKGDIDS